MFQKKITVFTCVWTALPFLCVLGSFCLFTLTVGPLYAQSESMLHLADPESLPIPEVTPAGYPEPSGAARNHTILTPERFTTPPAGFGEVPFWWWSGDALDRDRIAWQIRELHQKGVTGMQVNYAHKDSDGWPTFPNAPEIFSPEWWDFWAFAASECGKYGMGIGLSTYTLDWTKSKNLFNDIVYNDPNFHTKTLEWRIVQNGNLQPSENSLGFWAYPFTDEHLCGDGRPVLISDDKTVAEALETVSAALRKDFPECNRIQVSEFFWKAHPGTLNPIHPQAGARVIEKFFQPFEDHNPTKDATGLNWFFNDELRLGVPNQPWWCDDFPEKFRAWKGYDLFARLPELFTNPDETTGIKIHMDYADVQLQLAEERYFKPIYLWHYQRGLIFGCDNNGRGTQPQEYGDYFRAVRWYSAPGHDTPGGHADFIKGKVSSSIANLYHRPRVWLEGYHSLGWGATPDQLMTATNENFAYGCTLLNLHGLYYTTHGSMWEWAPPCYHFRMPYWKHFGTFLKNFERLSWVLAQGTWRSEIAIAYPTTPTMAGLGADQKLATQTAFEAAQQIYHSGRDITFMDDQSLLRAEIRDGKLCVSGMEFRVYVLPALRVVRWEALQKLHAFAKAGGLVVGLRKLPIASDRIGAEDPELNRLVEELFTAQNALGVFLEAADLRQTENDLTSLIIERFPQEDVHVGFAPGTSEDEIYQKSLNRNSASRIRPKFIHRQVGNQNVYFVTSVPAEYAVSFRMVGQPEYWNTMTGTIRPLEVIARTRLENGDVFTTVQMPSGCGGAALVVFQPDPVNGQTLLTPEPKVVAKAVSEPLPTVKLEGNWKFRLIPTMDNQWGDFRLPVTPDCLWIGAEARRFRYSELNSKQDSEEVAEWLRKRNATENLPENPSENLPENPSENPSENLPENPSKQLPEKLAALVDPALNDSEWPIRTCGFGTQFFLSSPSVHDQPYAFSWRVGVEMNPGHQGYHGNKKNISDHFIALGVNKVGLNETLFVSQNAPGMDEQMVLKTCVRYAGDVTIQSGGNLPKCVRLDGQPIPPETRTIHLTGKVQTLELDYATAGRGFWLLEKGIVPLRMAQPEEVDVPPHAFDGKDGRTPLSMTWFDADCVPFEPFAKAEGHAPRIGVFRFRAPAGLKKMVFILDEKLNEIPAVFVNGLCIPQERLQETKPFQKRTRRFVCDLPKTETAPAQVTIVGELPDSLEGGAFFAEPIRLETEEGEISQLADWSRDGTALETYSGGAVYSKTFMLSAVQADSPAVLKLGRVCATAEIRLNGQTVGTLVAQPWTLDVSGVLKEGENTLEIEVCNTLSNHYLTIPNRYRGNPDSGLIGPVEINFVPSRQR